MTDELCRVDIALGMGFRRCGNKVKGTLNDGTPACGRHISVEKKHEEKARQWEERYERDRANEEQAIDRAVQLMKLLEADGPLGLHRRVRPYWEQGKSYTGGVVLDAEDADLIIRLLTER